MKILHVSDNHGRLPKLQLEGVDVVVHSGDLLDNRTRGLRVIEESFQVAWIESNADKLREWIGDKLFLYCAGNHDFIDPVPHLKFIGINAFSLTDSWVRVGGFGFYGFPWVPLFTGEWNYEVRDPEMKERIEDVGDFLNMGTTDVLVAHGPIYGVRDRNVYGERCGSIRMREMLQSVDKPPRFYLCGHIHESNGHQMWSRDIIVSNAATTQRVLEI